MHTKDYDSAIFLIFLMEMICYLRIREALKWEVLTLVHPMS